MNSTNPVDVGDLLLKFNRHKNQRLIEHWGDLASGAKSERILGCLLGLAVGDVLGCPVEGMNYRDIQAQYRGGIQGLVSPRYGKNWRLPGLHSDDTQQALAVLEAMQRAATASRPLDARLVARELALIYVHGMQANTNNGFGCWRGTGSGFRTVVERLHKNQRAPDFPFGAGEPSAGLGAVMRIPPVGLLLDDPQSTVEMVTHITCVTHTDPLATVSASAIALACHLLQDQSPRSFQVAEFITHLVRQVQQIEQNPTAIALGQRRAPAEHQDKLSPLSSTLIALVGSLYEKPPDAAMQRIASEAGNLTGRKAHPTSGFAPSGVAASLYFFLYHWETPEEALLTSINAGGDTDTIGAIVGALCGALHGPLAFKAFLPDLLALDLIMAKAQASLDGQADHGFDLVAEESFLTELENNCRDLTRTR